MKRFFTLLFSSLTLTGFLQAQTMNFEALNLPIDTFWNGSDLSGKYIETGTSGANDSFIAYNSYDTTFNYWSGGIAISSMTDDSTGSFTNLYSSIAGGGHNSTNYGVVSAADTATIEIAPFASFFYEPRIMSLYVSNSTYAYFSMLNGDAFAKKFGGVSGDDPDYFFIRFSFEYGFPENYVDFYLADFRSADNNEDYVLDEWVFVDLNDFPNSEYVGRTIKMQLFSSDTSSVGINTPAFFCIDDMQIAYPGGIGESEVEDSELKLRVKQNSIIATMEESSSFQLLDLNGRLIQSSNFSTAFEFDTCTLPKGVYIVKAKNEKAELATKVWRW